MVKWDILLFQDLEVDDLIKLAELADTSGITNLWLVDSQDVYYEPWVTAGVIATHTENVRIGPGVTNPLTRHPRVTAASAEALHHYSGGRAVLGIGAGDSALRTMGEVPSLTKLKEGANYIRGRFEERQADIPLYISCHGWKSTLYACEVADGLIVAGDGARPEELRQRLGRIEAACKQVGRDMSTLPILSHYAIAISDNRQEALAETRGSVAKVMRMLLQYWDEWPHELASYKDKAEKLVEVYDYNHHMQPLGEHAQVVNDELIEIFGLAGTPDEVTDKLAALEAETKGLDFTFYLRPDFGGRLRTLGHLTQQVMGRIGAPTTMRN